MSTIIIIVISVLLYFIYIINKRLNYWREKQVIQDTILSIIKNTALTTLGFKSYPEAWNTCYSNYKIHRYYGDYQFFSPTLFLNDPDLIKTILIKDFINFPNRRTFANKDIDALYSKSLFDLEGNEWRCMRSSLSPGYTNIKMRKMFDIINDTTINYVKEYIDLIDASETDVIEVDCKDSFMKLTTDIIVKCLLGDSYKTAENSGDIYKMTDRARPVGFYKTMKFLIALNSPRFLSNLIGADFFPPEVRHFFRELVKITVQNQQRLNIYQSDFIDLLLKATSNKCMDEVYDTITSQVLVFSLAGFETLSTALNFCCYELAVHQEIQEKLYQEINQHQNNLNYDSLRSMNYLNMVISESLRKWPPALSIGRCCAQSYTIPAKNNNENNLQLSPGDKILISVFSIHRNEEFYPHPSRFDPERFSKQNSKLRNPYTYLPFGNGPRNCIASRFAQMKMKIILANLVQNFEFVITEKTPIPVQQAKAHMNLTPEKKIYLGYRRRLRRRQH